jgi:hypothetical protein
MRLSSIPAFVELTGRRKSVDAENHPRQDHANGDHRVVFCTFVVRCEPARAVILGGAGLLAVPWQYLDGVAAVINAQEAAGLDIVRMVNGL